MSISSRAQLSLIGQFYHNTYTWHFQMEGAKVIETIALFDTRDFDEFWTRVSANARLVGLPDK